MKELTIGKLADNHIVINDARVSRHHAKIVMNKVGTFEIIDLGSKNGTYVNGRKVKGQMPLKPGDRIMIATSPLQTNWFSLFSQIPDDEPTPQPEPTPAPIVNRRPSLPPSSVLYDFKKDPQSSFTEQCEQLKKHITNFKESLLLVRRPINIRHFSEDVLDLLIERYDFMGKQVASLLKKLEHESIDFQAKYDADIKKLNTTYQYRLSNECNENELTAALNEVEVRKNELQQHYDEMRREILPLVNNIIEEFYTNNPILFPQRLELAPANSSAWEGIPSQSEEIQKTFYLGEEITKYHILHETIELKKRLYVKSLYGGNLVFKYSKEQKLLCYNTTNTLISRMLAGSSNGNMRIVMVDFNEMEGTCNAFKGLNKNVFKIVSQYDEFIYILNTEAQRTENIIQNILQGDIVNIAEYNKCKTEKVAYTLLVLKDIPTGYSNEVWTKLAKIMRSGPRAGVSVLAIVDEEEVNRSEEAQKVFHYLQSAVNASSCETYDFTAKAPSHSQTSTNHDIHYDTLFNAPILAIVRKVNQGLEVKTETILKFSEYMLPMNDWWTGQSANRIDLPFGLTKEMKTSALQITQESGQNTAVVIGIPGSGKSVFLHTIIASAITHYSPVELQLYLLDFSGVEFNVYAKHKLPHARVIAPEAEREFGLSILREVFEEGNRRMTLCRENGVTNIVELKRVNPDLVVPRLLVIIDEFQKIFEIENDNISKEANAKIHAIIQEYRKFGINLILATQKLPAKSTVPYDLIANRVVFKSDPNDFNNLIKWPYSVPSPRLLTGSCIYNNESGAEVANTFTRSFFINASKELEDILDQVSNFVSTHSNMMDDHKLRTFRSDELPDFTQRIVAKHHKPQNTPREVGVYLGESIAIAPCHVYVPLTKESNNNILIIGGVPNIAKGIAYHTLLSEITAHTEKSSKILLMNFLMEDDPMQETFQSDVFADLSNYSDLQIIRTSEDVKNYLQYVKKEVIDARKNNPSLPLEHYYINIFDFQRGRMFDGTGGRGDLQSECGQLLEYILKNGPMVGVFTMLQVDNLTNLNRLCFNAQNLFCHRIALQMPEQDSNKVIGNSAANKLLVPNRPATNYRGLYYNYVNNSITKFKPYHYGSYRN